MGGMCGRLCPFAFASVVLSTMWYNVAIDSLFLHLLVCRSPYDELGLIRFLLMYNMSTFTSGAPEQLRDHVNLVAWLLGNHRKCPRREKSPQEIILAEFEGNTS